MRQDSIFVHMTEDLKKDTTKAETWDMKQDIKKDSRKLAVKLYFSPTKRKAYEMVQKEKPQSIRHAMGHVYS